MIWVDAHLSPALAKWIAEELRHQSVRDVGLRHAKDKDIFAAARQVKAIVLTKDADFAEMVERLGPPPAVIWLTCGNTSNAALRVLLREAFERLGGFERCSRKADQILAWLPPFRPDCIHLLRVFNKPEKGINTLRNFLKRIALFRRGTRIDTISNRDIAAAVLFRGCAWYYSPA